jgi:hypothetical protein
LDVLDKSDHISVEGFGKVDVFGVLSVGDCPLGGIDDALSARVGVGQFAGVLRCFGLGLLVGDDQLILFHAVAELFAEGKLGMGNDIEFD